MNASVSTMAWIVMCDTGLSFGRERHVFTVDDDMAPDPAPNVPYDPPMMRAYRFARFHMNECRAEGFTAGTVDVFCQHYRDSTLKTFYVSDPDY